MNLNLPMVEYFGCTPSGERVDQIILDNGSVVCKVITFGAAIRTLCVPDRNGRAVDVVLGYDTLGEYETQGGYLGATVGRYANRISGSRFSIRDKSYTLYPNDGENHLHGGKIGYSHRVWRIDSVAENSVRLSLDSYDGEEGYPANLKAYVTYSLRENALIVNHEAIADGDTICNLINHSYFNLSGHDSGVVDEQKIRICAQSFTPTDAACIPTGDILSVEGTPMDLRSLTEFRDCFNSAFQQLRQARGADHNFVVCGDMGELRLAAEAQSMRTGISMRVYTTLPGLQLYTANFIEPGTKGKNGCHYGPHHAFCLETQYFPDSPNQPSFPSALLRTNQWYNHTTEYLFARM